MMEQIVIGLVLVIVAVVCLGAVGFGRAAPVVEQRPAVPTEPELVDDDEGWIPHSLGEVTGYASVSQGGQVVGYAAMRRLHLPPGWESGQKGMRPYTREARHVEAERRRQWDATGVKPEEPAP